MLLEKLDGITPQLLDSSTVPELQMEDPTGMGKQHALNSSVYTPPVLPTCDRHKIWIIVIFDRQNMINHNQRLSTIAHLYI